MTHAHEPWRAELVRRSGQAIVLFGLLVSPYVLGRVTRWGGLLAFFALIAGGAVAAWLPTVHLRVRGLLLVGVLLVAGGHAVLRLGLVPGSLLCLALATLLSAVLFGSRVASLVVLASALELVVLGAAGRAETAPAAALEQLVFANWVRMGLVYATFTGLLVVLVSATLRRVEESLSLAQQSETRLRLLVEHLPVMVDCVDADGRIRYWNRECERVTGYAAAEVVDNPRALELLYPDAAHRARMLAEWRARGTKYRNWAWSLTAKDGSTRTIEWSHLSDSIALLEWPNWQIGVDVTERNRAEAAVRHNEELFRAVVEDQTEMVVRWRPDGTRTFVNQAYCRVFGQSAADLVGTSFMPLVAESYRETVTRKVLALTPADPVATHIHESVTAAGERRWQEWTDRGIFDADGRLVELQSTGRDITDRTKVQEALNRAERMAAIGALVAGVAHEVRTPLFGITATLDAYAIEPNEPPERHQAVELLRQQVKRLNTLMFDLLDYGRPPALSLSCGGVSEPIEKALQSCARRAEAAGVRLVAELGDVRFELLRDPDRLEQVFENLLSNAIAHSPRGGTVRVVVAARDSAPTGLACTVEDEGPGIPEEERAKLFEPFFSRRKGGTGLGLAIVQRFVEEHGGSVLAENRAGGGALFTVLLPASRPGAAVLPEAPSGAQAPRAHAAPPTDSRRLPS
jgi:PAS domain S-box-containing protein